MTLGTIDEDKDIESHVLPLLVEEATSWGEIELPRRVVLHSSDGAQFEVPPASLLSSGILKGRMMTPHHRSFIREAPIEVEDAAASAQAAAAPPTIVRLLSRGTSDDAVEGVCTALTGLRAHSSSDAATCGGAHDGYDAESETINLYCLEQAAILRKVCEFFHHLDEEPLGEIPRPLLSEDLAQCGIPGTVPCDFCIVRFLLHHPYSCSCIATFSDRYVEFVNVGESTEEQETLFNLILVANDLNIKPLLDITCAKVASMIKGKRPREIRAMFNIADDFTPEEREQVLRENPWLQEENEP